MITVLTEKHHWILAVCTHYCLSAFKGLGLITGGIGGLIIGAVLLFPFFRIVGFLLKAIGL